MIVIAQQNLSLSPPPPSPPSLVTQVGNFCDQHVSLPRVGRGTFGPKLDRAELVSRQETVTNLIPGGLEAPASGLVAEGRGWCGTRYRPVRDWPRWTSAGMGMAAHKGRSF